MAGGKWRQLRAKGLSKGMAENVNTHPPSIDNYHTDRQTDR